MPQSSATISLLRLLTDNYIEPYKNSLAYIASEQ